MKEDTAEEQDGARVEIIKREIKEIDHQLDVLNKSRPTSPTSPTTISWANPEATQIPNAEQIPRVEIIKREIKEIDHQLDVLTKSRPTSPTSPTSPTTVSWANPEATQMPTTEQLPDSDE